MYNIISHPFLVYSIFVTLLAYIMVYVITKHFITNNDLTGWLWLSVLLIAPLGYLLDYGSKTCVYGESGQGLHFVCLVSNPMTGILFPLLILFLAFAIFRTVKGIFGYYQIKGTVSSYSVVSSKMTNIIKAKLGLTIPVYVVDLPMGTAFTLGFINPRIYISNGIVSVLDEDELGCVLVHGAKHVKARDNLFKLVFILIRDIMFFNPLINLALKKYYLSREISCDKEASNCFSLKTLHSSLYKIAKNNLSPYSSSFSDCSFSQRLDGLNKDKHIVFSDYLLIAGYLFVLTTIVYNLC